eukprot:TCALIF_07056-PA protein Name:"Similar to vrp1 Verprolin (Schizosaccharomyces pombe (strain 972 / ATCC 24843))" AED:0.07 eAED:0.11 QI:644/0.83/0.85/1/0.5/0.42/7/0/483
MPPPPPPPGPPPPPVGGLSPAKLGVPAGPTDRGALLKSIQQGKALKKTVTNDRSGPSVGGKPTAPAQSGNGRAGGASLGQASSASTPKLPGIGGIFAGGFPTLNRTQGGVHTGRAADVSHSTTNLASTPKVNANTSISSTPQNGSQGRNYFNRSNSNAGIHQHNSFSSSSLNSTPSLTPPSASPGPSVGSSSSSSYRKPSHAPGPPENLVPRAKPSSKVQHPNSKPPPPPVPNGTGPSSLNGGGQPPPKPRHTLIQTVGNQPAMRAKSFNHKAQNPGYESQRSRDDSSLSAPPPPTRTVSQSSGTLKRPGGPAPPPPTGGMGRVATRSAPMKPPTQPPPPPPHRDPGGHSQPQPSVVQKQASSHYARSNVNMGGGSNDAPTPPTRRHSLRNNNHSSNNNVSSGYNSSASSNSGGESFEQRFQNRFKTPQFLPPPEPYVGVTKTYPSKTQPQLDFPPDIWMAQVTLHQFHVDEFDDEFDYWDSS